MRRATGLNERFLCVVGGQGTEWSARRAVSLAEATYLSGDFNLDATVDAADYVVWRKTGGSPDDYNAWQTNFAHTLFTGSAADAIPSTFPLPPSPLEAAIPEPSTLALAAMALVRLIARFKRRR